MCIDGKLKNAGPFSGPKKGYFPEIDCEFLPTFKKRERRECQSPVKFFDKRQ